MDVVWLIIDSLSLSATPFADNGPSTMPQLEDVADDAVVFTNAYAPGPSSSSSHGSFFTGELPSKTGMHEAHPNFDGELPTIATALSESHRSLVVSSNPFIFNGLHEGFDEHDDLAGVNPIFESASDPEEYKQRESELGKYWDFLTDERKPIRSLVNALHFKHRLYKGNTRLHADQITNRIRNFVNRDNQDSLVVANYMDVHAPLTASDEAIERFAPQTPRNDLPIGVTGKRIHERIQTEEDYDGEDMYALYKAAIWDLDRKIAPLVQELVKTDTLVILTADHGNWFRRKHSLDQERLHVPLLVFAPEIPAQSISHTVNIRSLPRTTMEIATGDSGGFSGNQLLKITEDQLSITEFIHIPETDGRPVTPSGVRNVDEGIVYEIAAIKNGARVDYNGTERIIRREESPLTDELTHIVNEYRKQHIKADTDEIEYNKKTENRLRDLGYL